MEKMDRASPPTVTSGDVGLFDSRDNELFRLFYAYARSGDADGDKLIEVKMVRHDARFELSRPRWPVLKMQRQCWARARTRCTHNRM